MDESDCADALMIAAGLIAYMADAFNLTAEDIVADGPNYLDMSRFGLLAVEENEVVG
jgi:hypothetical protein